MPTEFKSLGALDAFASAGAIDTSADYIPIWDASGQTTRLATYGVFGGAQNSRNRVINVIDYGVTDFTGATDHSTQLQAAFDAAFTAKLPVYIPAGIIGLNSQVTVKTPIIAAGHGPRSAYKVPLYGTRFLNLGGINSGQAMLLIDSIAVGSETARGWWCEGFTIDGAGYSCIGLQATGISSGNLFSRAILRRVFVTGCTTGIDLLGFTYTLDNCYAIENGTGLLLRLGHSVTIAGGQYSPNNDKDSWAVVVWEAENLSFDNVNIQSISGQLGNGLDLGEGVKNCRVRCYFESMAGTASQVGYHLRVGGISKTGGSASNTTDTAAREIDIDFTWSGASATDSSVYGSLGPRIHLGNVIGVNLGRTSMIAKNLEVSQYARDISGAIVGGAIIRGATVGAPERYTEYQWVSDATGMVGRPARSWIPNPSGAGSSGAAIRGYKEIIRSSNITIAAETSITRGGGASIKVTRAAAATGTSERAIFYPFGQEALIAQKGTVILTGWIYVPDASGNGVENDAYDENGSSNLRVPTIGFEYNDGTDQTCHYTLLSGSGSTAVATFTVGAWNRFFCAKPIADFGAITKLGWSVKPLNAEAPVLSGSKQDHSVYIADVALCVSPQSWNDVMAGQFSLASEAGVFIGQNFHVYDSAAPTDPDTYWLRGDVVWNTAPSAGGSPGWVCTTSGAGGSAVFRAMANVA